MTEHCAEREWVDLGSPTVGRVYGFRSSVTGEFRYVGQTTKSLRRRHGQHLQVARSGRKTPFYDWLRVTPASEYEIVLLEPVASGREDLGEAEIAWITYLRAAGDRLLNLSEGGLGPIGVAWTDERRAALAERNRSRQGPSLWGEANPMWGKHHSEEQKARWSEARKGQNSGVDNPNFGKFGPDHPSYGRPVSDETRAKLSDQKQGERNPNYGKQASQETRERMSAARKGRPMPSSVRNAHTRHHTNKGVVSETCRHCAEDAQLRAQDARKKGNQ